ncbi:MAG: NAD(P)-dependent oxidoreductase [Thermoprotei archaeon]|nr:NAD(P)-dependent oxidoreductase [Thermoprotei archaeon]
MVVGGLGYLGVNAAEELHGRGFQVIIVGRRGSETRRPRITAHIKSMGLTLKLLEHLRAEELKALGGDVYHYLVGIISGSLEEFRRAHVKLLGEAVKAAGELGARVVYVSAISSIGEVRGVKPGSTIYEEEEHLNPEVHKHYSYHGLTKAEGERLLRNSRELRGKWSIVRPGLLIGPWAYHPEWAAYLRLASMRIAPKLGRRIALIHVKDVAEILAEAGEGRYDGLWVNAVAHHPDMSDIVREECKQLKVKCATIPVKPLVKAALALKPLMPRGSPIAMMLELLSLNYEYRSRILRREWRGLEDAVKDFLEWAKNYGVKP